MENSMACGDVLDIDYWGRADTQQTLLSGLPMRQHLQASRLRDRDIVLSVSVSRDISVDGRAGVK